MNSESEFAVLKIGGKEIKLPVVVGTEGEKAFDIAQLRKETGYVSLDQSLTNTAVCYSSITFIDGEKASSDTAAFRLRNSSKRRHS